MNHSEPGVAHLPLQQSRWCLFYGAREHGWMQQLEAAEAAEIQVQKILFPNSKVMQERSCYVLIKPTCLSIIYGCLPDTKAELSS